MRRISTGATRGVVVGTSHCDKGSGLVTSAGRSAMVIFCQDPKVDHVVVLDNATGRRKLMLTGLGLGYLRMTSRYLGVASGSGPYPQYAYDFRHSKLLRIGEGRTQGDMPGVGPVLTWGESDPTTHRTTTHVVRLK